tara:strand:- start:1101 stop:1556 length:456 start_codon:yes stop_codon:yes gene_type:complete
VLNYRTLDIDDLDILLDAAVEFFAESRFSNIPMDVGRSRAVLSAFLCSTEAAVFGALDGDYVAGLLIVERMPDLWADREFAQEIALYVRPAYRSTRIGSDLITSLIGWADSNALAVRMTIDSGIVDERVANALERRGLQRRGWIMGREAVV